MSLLTKLIARVKCICLIYIDHPEKKLRNHETKIQLLSNEQPNLR